MTRLRAWLTWIRWWLTTPPEVERVIVNLKTPSNEALRGLLWKKRGPYFVLREAEALIANAKPVALEGEITIPRENCAFYQVLP